ncbi:MAG: LamG-like jellyroll fold domain-containing protein [Sideroxyarcus sp.]|nr:LamG-like jellyroll fold domain-containing protein [Sideroxyarcus sp.]
MNNILLCRNYRLIKLLLPALCVVALSLLNGWSAMAATATASPATCASVVGIGSVDWSNSTQAVSSDNNRASASVDGSTTRFLRCTGYGFAIPAGATIDGITVNVERRSSRTDGGGSVDAAMRLVKAGVIGTTDHSTSTTYTTSDVVEAHGSASDLLWGTTWTAADINNTNFGAAFAATKASSSGNAHTISVDHIQIVVNYTPAPRSCVSVVTGNWSNANTWNCGAGPGDGPPTAIDSVTINNQVVSLDTSASAVSLTVNSGTLQQTGSVARSLSISGNVTNSGTVADNGINGSFDLTVGGNLTVNGTSFTVDNLTVAGNTTIGATFTVRTDFNVGGDLTNNSAALTVNNLIFERAGTQAATFYGTLSSVTNLTVNAGSTVSSANYSTLNLRGNLTNNGAISLPNTSWLINGTTAQSIGGITDTGLGNLTMNNASGLTLSRNVTVPGTLTLTSGDIATGVFSLIASANCPGAVSGGSAASYVNGNLRLTYPAWSVTCVYPVGSAMVYAPISVTVPHFAGIAGGTLTGSAANGEHPQISTSGINPAQDVNRYWTLGAVGDTMSTLPSGGSYTATFNFVAGDVDVGATVSTFQVGMRGATTWSALAGSASGTTATYPGQTIFGSYAVGAVLPPVVTLGKSAGTSAAAVDSYVTYELTATNSTPGALNNVVLTDVIPATMTYTTNAATLGTVNVVGQTLTWTIPYLPSGGSAQLTLVVQPTAQGTYTNTVTSPGATPASADILILPSAITRYSMDEAAGSWTGATGEVIDSGGNGLNGRRRTTTTPTTTNTVAPSPTIASEHPSVVGGFCNAGSFDGRAVVESASSPYFQFTNRLSASAWIYPTAYPTGGSDLYSILSNDVNYEFHLNQQGRLYWWWNSSTLTSAAIIPTNQWTHIAITFDSTPGNRRQRIYINGVEDVNTNNWTGTLATNACPFYIGGDIATGSGCGLLPARNFHGMIDEAKIYDYELTAAEVQADMNLGRLCGASTFDHIQIEHDGTASTCAPKTVTVKACMNASCSSLYPGTVTVHLSPNGWTPSDILTINGGVATATLNNSAISAPTLTLGTTSVSPNPAGATRCFNGATETCTLSVGATDCSFDAVEVGANPQTHLYTKLAGTAFNLDVVAVGTPATTVDTTKNTTVSVDLVDTSSAACSSTSTALNTAQSVTLAAGRRTVSMTCAAVAPSAQVRIRIGSAAPYTYACSYDKFAVRPSAVVLNSTNTLATPPSPSDANTIRAGASFNLGAATAPTGYIGVLTLVPSALTAQLPSNVSAQISGGTVGALALTPFTVNTVTYNSAIQANTAQGSNATYSEVGYFYANPGTFRDTGFTSVDQINQLPNCATTDTCDCLLSANTTNGTVPNNLSDVLINGRYGCYVGNKTGFAFGRFIPDHFDTAIGTVAGVPMLCPAGQICPCPSGSICPPAASTGFVYSGQNFTTQVMARNLAGGTTLNYYSNYAHAVTLGAWDAPGSVADQNPNGALANTAITAATFGAGVATTAIDRPLYTLDTVATAPTDIYLRATESAGGDGVTSRRASAPATSVEGGVQVRVGRMKVSSAYGSEQLPLPLTATVQYWDGTSWLTSSTDNVTSFNPATMLVTIRKGPLLVGNVVVTNIGSVAVAAGLRSFTVNRPGIAGSADILLGGADAPSYLLTGSNGEAVNPGVAGLVTFGVYKGANQFIYMREAY